MNEFDFVALKNRMKDYIYNSKSIYWISDGSWKYSYYSLFRDLCMMRKDEAFQHLMDHEENLNALYKYKEESVMGVLGGDNDAKNKFKNVFKKAKIARALLKRFTNEK